MTLTSHMDMMSSKENSLLKWTSSHRKQKYKLLLSLSSVREGGGREGGRLCKGTDTKCRNTHSRTGRTRGL